MKISLTFRPVGAIALALVAVALVASGLSCGTASESPEVPAPATATATLEPAEPSPTPNPTPTPVLVALPSISLPEDDGPHMVPTEWWYFNGHLGRSQRPELGFHFVIFKVAAPGGEGYALMGHLSMTDLESGTHVFEERVTLVEAVSGEGLDLNIDGWSISGEDGIFFLQAGTGRDRFDIEVRAAKPPVVHPGEQGDGLVYYSPEDISYYYSYTRLDASGTLVVGADEGSASGIVWMDHQWGDFEINLTGWDWFSIQLDDGSELMVATIAAGDGTKEHIGTYVDAMGNVQGVSGELTARDAWTSPTTGGTYPLDWELLVPELEMRLSIVPVVRDAEIDPAVPNVPTYWEGPVRATGMRGEVAISGIGFAELVGYAPSE